jgi:hypothetical protein
MQEKSVLHSADLSIQKRIEQAQTLYAAWEDSLRQDPSIRTLLQRLNTNIENTWKAMRELGVVEECKRCEEEEGGSCCGEGIEDRYDAVLLLINLLLGVSLPVQPHIESSCYLLGKNGCILKARHVLCVNYICEKLKNTFTPDKLITLQEIAGEELETLFILYEAIKKWIRTYST